MNDLYAFGGAYSFQDTIDPILESELRKCKTQQERDAVTEAYQTIRLFGTIAAIVIGALVCGVISLLA
jgi:hypothetical protein